MLQTLADVTGHVRDVAGHHFVVQILEVEGLHGEGQCAGQHGEHAHASNAHGNTSHINSP